MITEVADIVYCRVSFTSAAEGRMEGERERDGKKYAMSDCVDDLALLLIACDIVRLPHCYAGFLLTWNILCMLL